MLWPGLPKVLSLNAHAIVVKTCPNVIEVTLGEFLQADEYPSNAMYAENPGAVKASYNFMKYMNDFTTEMELVNTNNSRCLYKSDYATAVIKGSTRPGAKNPAKLAIFWGMTLTGGTPASYEAIIPLTDVAGNELTLKFEGGYASMWHNAVHCYWGECGPSWFDMGRANLVEVNVIQ